MQPSSELIRAVSLMTKRRLEDQWRVARMERSAIRGPAFQQALLSLDYASLHPGYEKRRLEGQPAF